MEEVIVPLLRDRRDVKAIRVTVRGRNFRAVAQPLIIFVGKTPLQFLSIAPDERSAEGLLLAEPEAGAFVESAAGRPGCRSAPGPGVPAEHQAVMSIRLGAAALWRAEAPGSWAISPPAGAASILLR
jgi:hypothetical protein